MKPVKPNTEPAHEWDRLPDEPQRAYADFVQYLELGARRTFREAWRKAGKGSKGHPSGSFNRASMKYRWRERALAYDAHLREQEEALWEARRHALLEEEWRAGEALRQRLEELAQLPLERWSASDLPRLAIAASDLKRRAAGLPTGRQALELSGRVDVGLDAIANAPKPETEEQARELLQRIFGKVY